MEVQPGVRRVTHHGGCHCGRVKFEVDAPDEIVVDECNCSICSMLGYLHLIVPRADFRLLTPEHELTTYRFGTNTAQHHFCGTCGVKSFYVPRSHPEGLSVNARCLAPSTIRSRTVVPFDGQNWERNVEELRSRTPG